MPCHAAAVSLRVLGVCVCVQVCAEKGSADSLPVLFLLIESAEAKPSQAKPSLAMPCQPASQPGGRP